MFEPTAHLGRVAILCRGDQVARRSASPDSSRFKAVFASLADAGVDAEPVVYEDDVLDEVRANMFFIVWRANRKWSRCSRRSVALLLCPASPVPVWAIPPGANTFILAGRDMIPEWSHAAAPLLPVRRMFGGCACTCVSGASSWACQETLDPVVFPR
jgi:hypothetical protein